ncbi:MAG: response regulator [Planctomycetes bacterium]|nr:response regulator [Planctomycetota bacterium]
MGTGKPLILMVEDSSAHAQLLTLAVREATPSAEIRVAENAVTAFRMLSQRDEFAEVRLPMVIVLDANLPAISGVSMLRTIKGDRRWKHIPVVMFSSSALDRDVCLAAGAAAYVIKPPDFAGYVTFARTLEPYLAGKRRLSATR